MKALSIEHVEYIARHLAKKIMAWDEPIPPDELYELAIWVAESRPPAKDGTVQAIKDYLKKYMTERKKTPRRNR